MDDLAAELRMSKKTLYACFPSKSSLVEAVLKDKFHEVEADLSRLASERSFDMEEAIRRFLQRVQAHTAEIHPSFVRDLGRESPDLFWVVEHRPAVGPFCCHVALYSTSGMQGRPHSQGHSGTSPH